MWTRIQAGIHNAHRFDVVAARLAPLDKPYSKRYDYALIDTLAYKDGVVYAIDFDADDFTGRLYIEDSSFAFVKGEYWIKKSKLKSNPMSASASTRLFLTFTVEYDKRDSLYMLSYINYKTSFISDERRKFSRIYLNNFFYRERHERAYQPIPIQLQVPYQQALIKEIAAKPVSGVNTTGTAARKRKPVLLRELGASIGVGLRDGSFTGSFSAPELNEWQRLRNPFEHMPVYFSNVEIFLRNRFSFDVGFSRSFDRSFRGGTLLVNYRFPLSFSNRWQVALGTGYNFSDYKASVLRFTPAQSGNVNGQLVDLAQADIEVDGNAGFAMASTTVSYMLDPRIRAFFRFEAMANVNTAQRFYLRQDGRDIRLPDQVDAAVKGVVATAIGFSLFL